MSLPNLAQRHYEQLATESAIADDVIAERGYRTVTDASELKDLGFAPSQRRVPGLLLPQHTPDGQNTLYIYRPDNARVIENKRKGKLPDGTYPQRVIKYEQPKGEPVRVDCPPRCLPNLADPSVPLFITEGQKKADALASRGACAIALTGVWNWKSRNKYGGTTFTNDLDYIAFDGRDVYLIFDSDVTTNTNVRKALQRFTEHLKRKGAVVSQCHLPPGDNGKQGVDDWFAANPDKTLDDLKSLAEGPRPEPKPAPDVVELLDAPPAMMRRPMALIGGRSYAATWLYVKVTRRESRDKRGNIVRHDPPIEMHERRLFIIRDDGVIFGDGATKSMTELPLEVALPETPAAAKLLSASAVKAYTGGYRPDPVATFNAVVDIVDRFIDFNKSLAEQRTMAELVACYILATWFLDAFNVAGNIWPNGDRGSGKTQLLVAVGELAYLGQVVLAGGSYASLRDLADYGATLLFDDAEDITNPHKSDPDKRTLLLAGNRRGNTVTIKEQVGYGNWQTRHVNTYAFRGFSAIRLPDNVLASRTIIIPLIRTPDRYRANADPLEFDLWPHDKRQLLDDLWLTGLAYLAELPAYEKQANQQARLTGRNLEPWRAILAVALWLDGQGMAGLWQRMEALSMAYQSERPDLELSDLTALAIRALCRVVKGKISDVSDVSAISDIKKEIGANVFVLTSQVTKHAHDVIEEHEIDIDPEFVTSRRMGRVLGKMRFSKVRENGTGKRGWQFTFDELHGWTTSYGLLIEQEIGVDVTDTNNVTTRIPNVTNGNNVTNVTVNGTNGAGASFVPSSEWQEIPDGTPVPPGGEYRMDMDSGKNYGRWPGQAPPNGNGFSAVFTEAEIGRVAGPPDKEGRRAVKDSHGLWFDEAGRLWDGDEAPLHGTILWLRGHLEATE